MSTKPNGGKAPEDSTGKASGGAGNASGDNVKPSGGSTDKKSILEIVEEIKFLKGHLVDAKKKISSQSSTIKDEDRNVEKLCKELEYISVQLNNLNKFELDLRKPLALLRANVEDITGDTAQLSTNQDVSEETKEKRLQHNINVLRSNITKLKIKIPLNHQPVITSSEANRDFQKTVASSKFGDLPSLCEESMLIKSQFFKEVKRMFKEDLADPSFLASLYVQSPETSAEEERRKNLDTLRLKLCLLSFAIFPEDAEISRRLMKLWWIGEDIIPDEEFLKKNLPEKEKTDGLLARVYADKILNKFVDLGFIVPVKKDIRPDRKAKTFKMPPLMRAALILLAKEAQFFKFDKKEKGNPSGVPDVDECKRICLVKKEDYEKQKLPLKEVVLKKMETVFNVSEQYPDLRIPLESFAKMENLGVLYLGRWETTAKRHIEVENTDFLKYVKKMKKLKFLSFQGVSRITTLPSLGVHLSELRILDLRACYNLELLPDGLDFLKRLTYLDISECYLLDFMPTNLTALSRLKVLKGFVISDHEDSCKVNQLHGLKQLNKLSIIVNTEEFNADTLQEELSDFQALEKLKVSWGGRPEVRDKKDGEEGVQSEQNGKVDNKKGDEKASEGAGAEPEPKGKVDEEAVNTGANPQQGSEGNKNRGVGSAKPGTTKKDNKNAVKSVFSCILNCCTDDRIKKKKGIEGLKKLDLECYPFPTPPSWLKPENMPVIEKLYIRGGNLKKLEEIKVGEEKWNAVILRLKYMNDFKMNWREILEIFPKLWYLERVRCPKVTFCPCDGNGVWFGPKEPKKTEIDN